MLAPSLLEILRCPKSLGTLVYFPRGEQDRDEADGFLLCPQSKLRYRIEAGVPVMLIEEATVVGDAELARLLDRAKQLGLG